MTGEFVRFPHTPHLLWLGPGAPRGDKLLDRALAESFFRGPVPVEEKVDGANLGVSLDDAGVLRARSRGGHVDAHSHPPFAPLRRWLGAHADGLAEALGPGLMLFGEWCRAVHSVEYRALPDWFLAFDVYDRATGRFWAAGRRDELCASLGISTVPLLGAGVLGRAGLLALVGRSTLGAATGEGIYVRREAAGELVARAKVVRAEFQQAIGDHWSGRLLRLNRLAEGG